MDHPALDNTGFTVFPDILKDHSAVILRVKQSKTEALESFQTVKQCNIPEGWFSTPLPNVPLSRTKHLHVPTGTGNINNIQFELF